METYRCYKGCVIKQQLKSYYTRWQVWSNNEYVAGCRTRQQARDYITNLIKENHGNTPAGIQNTVSIKK